MTRRKLPDRRLGVTKKIKHILTNGKEQSITVTFGVCDKKVVEVFTNSFKAGTDLEALVIDASIMLSRLLQHGDDIVKLCESLCKPHSLIGTLAFQAMLVQEGLNETKAEEEKSNEF